MECPIHSDCTTTTGRIAMFHSQLSAKGVSPSVDVFSSQSGGNISLVGRLLLHDHWGYWPR